MISVWGSVMSYLDDARSGSAERPWLPSSANARLSVQLHECDALLSSRHFLRNVSLPTRSEMLEHQTYWNPWALMQISTHALPAVLNHPLIHLVANANHGATQSRFFLQQTVDQALFHSAWVGSLVRKFEALSLEINDPVIGNMVAATATILWLFQFVRESKVSRRAKENLDQCESFLQRMAPMWPQIAHKVPYSLSVYHSHG